MPSRLPDSVVLDATIFERLAVRDLVLGLGDDLIRPYWTQLIINTAVQRLKRSRIRGGLGSQRPAVEAMRPLTRFAGALIDEGAVRSAREQLVVLPADEQSTDAAAGAVAVSAERVLTFRLPPVRFRSLTVAAPKGGVGRVITFVLADVYLTNLFEQIRNDDKSEILRRINWQASQSRPAHVSDPGVAIQTLLGRLDGQGLRSFVKRLRPEFRSLVS